MEKKEIIPVRDKEGDFIFRRDWLSNYAVIDGPMNKVELEVTNNPNLYEPKDGTSNRYIVNFKAVLRSDLPELKKKFGTAKYIKANELNKLFMNGTVWVNEGQQPVVPMKGEKVLCNIDYVWSPTENKDVLRVTNIHVKEPEAADKIDLDAMFADDPEGDFRDAAIEQFEKAAK